jgi:hypothetical protein
MQHDEWPIRRMPNGSIDYGFYVRAADAARKAAIRGALERGVRVLVRLAKAPLRAAVRTAHRLVQFWNIPPLGAVQPDRSARVADIRR